nr:MAG TPA: hypothetical protein [Caudoviricetes sp.]
MLISFAVEIMRVQRPYIYSFIKEYFCEQLCVIVKFMQPFRVLILSHFYLF